MVHKHFNGCVVILLVVYFNGCKFFGPKNVVSAGSLSSAFFTLSVTFMF